MQTRVEKSYELNNHLGNVLVTVSDKKEGVDNNNDGTINYYTADILSAQVIIGGGNEYDKIGQFTSTQNND